MESKIKNPKINLAHSILLLCLFVLSGFILFYNLGALSIRVWDEGINAVNAIEMLQNKIYLIRYHNGQPDMWQTLPPLLTWTQVISMRLFGINEFAIRFPLALSAFLTIVFMNVVAVKIIKDRFTGVFSSLILVSSIGYIGHHVARTGDHDAMLTFFLFLSAIMFYLFIHNPQKKGIYLTLLTICLIFAAYTKSIAGLFFIPGFFLYTLLQKKFRYVFGYKWTYVSIVSFLVIVLGYFFLREKFNPGFLDHVWNDQLFPRFTNTSKNYSYEIGSYWFYFSGFAIKERFVPWIYFLPFCILFTFINKNRQHRQISIYLIVVSITFLLIISFGSKGFWYDAPVYPLFAVIIGLNFMDLLEWLLDKFSLSHGVYRFFTILLIIVAISFYPIKKAIKRETLKKEVFADGGELHSVCYYLDEKIDPELHKGLKVCYIGFETPPLFYIHKLNYLYSMDVRFENYALLEKDDWAVTSNTECKKYIEANYLYRVMDERNYTTLYKIDSVLVAR
jgi:4-amino-4-deoxy-L-arabinose transferase-like glycosyltransferase